MHGRYALGECKRHMTEISACGIIDEVLEKQRGQMMDEARIEMIREERKAKVYSLDFHISDMLLIAWGRCPQP